MARLLSQQEDFANQPSMLETLIRKAGHECIFLPNFHCELNPIKMVSEFGIQCPFVSTDIISYIVLGLVQIQLCKGQ
jgi:hypothetical protein